MPAQEPPQVKHPPPPLKDSSEDNRRVNSSVGLPGGGASSPIKYLLRPAVFIVTVPLSPQPALIDRAS